MMLKKVCMLGSFAVGKTSLVRRFVESIFSEEYLTTVGVRVDKKVISVENQDVTVMLWDLGGDDEIQPLRMSYLAGASGLFFVADGTRRATLTNVIEIKEAADKLLGPVPFVLVLNKFDLADQWETDAQKELELASCGWTIFYTSAKTGEGVEQAFYTLAQAIVGG
jgi:small GTP-binding protein